MKSYVPRGGLAWVAIKRSFETEAETPTAAAAAAVIRGVGFQAATWDTNASHTGGACEIYLWTCRHVDTQQRVQ